MSTLSVGTPRLYLPNPNRLTAAAHAAIAATAVLIGCGLALGGSTMPAKAVGVCACVLALGHGFAAAWLWLNWIIDADVPGPLRHSPRSVVDLLSQRVIHGTYVRPAGIVGLVLHKFLPRVTYLSPGLRSPSIGMGTAAVGVILGCMAAAATPVALLLAVPFLIEIAARTVAIWRASAGLPTAEGVAEHLQHLGDKGDPVGLYQHVRRTLEGFRDNPVAHRYLVDRSPNIAELVQDARVELEILVETQPEPAAAGPRVNQVGMVLDLAAAGVAVLGWICLAAAASAAVSEGSANWIWAPYVAGGAAQLVGWRLLGAAKRVHNTFWFSSEIYWIRVDGSYNTTRVGSRDQRTSFQSDLHLRLHTATIITESSLGDGDGRTDGILHSPRWIITTEPPTRLQPRSESLLSKLHNYQDLGGQARTTNLSSPEYHQHVQRLQLETMVVEQARALAWQAAVPGLGGLASGAQQPGLPQVASPALPAPASLGAMIPAGKPTMIPGPRTLPVPMPARPAVRASVPPPPKPTTPPAATPPTGTSGTKAGGGTSPLAAVPPHSGPKPPPPPPPRRTS